MDSKSHVSYPNAGILHISAPFFDNNYTNTPFIVPSIFLGTDEVFTVACSPTDASLVASGGKEDRGFLWRIGSEEGALELTGIVFFVIFLFVGWQLVSKYLCTSSDIFVLLFVLYLYVKYTHS